MTKALIIDLYGTLLYSSIRKKPYLDLFKQMGLSKDEMSKWRRIVMTENLSFSDIKHLIDPMSNIYTDKYLFDVNLENENTHLFPDTIPFLEEVSKRYKLFLLSNIATPYKSCFYQLGLDKFFVKPYFSCDIGYAKPEPQSYDMILKENGLKKSEVIMIGDSLSSDYEGAKNYGIRAILKDKSLLDVLDKI